MKKYSFLIGCLVLGITINSCSDDNSNTPTDEKAKLELRLTDAPANFDAVYIDVIGISYKMSKEIGKPIQQYLKYMIY